MRESLLTSLIRLVTMSQDLKKSRRQVIYDKEGHDGEQERKRVEGKGL